MWIRTGNRKNEEENKISFEQSYLLICRVNHSQGINFLRQKKKEGINSILRLDNGKILLNGRLPSCKKEKKFKKIKPLKISQNSVNWSIVKY